MDRPDHPTRCCPARRHWWLLIASFAVGLLSCPLNAEGHVRPTSAGGRAAIVWTSDLPTAGLQFTLLAESGVAFTDIQVARGVDQAAWFVDWHQVADGEVRVVVMSRSTPTTHTGVMTILSAAVRSDLDLIVSIRDVVASDSNGRQVPMEGGEIRWASEPVAAVAAIGNYPNPFNPSTVISYDLTKSGHTYLAVYDLLGREVAVLLDGWQEAGRHAVSWELAGRRVASGVYVARISTAGTSAVLRMTVLP